MNAVNAKDGAAYSPTADRTVDRAEILRVAEDPPNVCVLESAPEVVLDVIHG